MLITSASVLLKILFLLVVKHFICDFVLQTKYMLGKFKPWPSYVLPLGLHSLINAIGTFVILFFTPSVPMWVVVNLVILDFVMHFLIDRLKASPKLLGRFNDTNKKSFWVCLGFDQMLHYVVYLTIASIAATIHH